MNDYLQGRASGPWARDVGEAARDVRRRRRCRERARPSLSGGVRGARAPLQVCKSRFGGYAWAGARQGAFAHTFCDLNGVFERLRCAQGLRRHPPEMRGGRRAPGGREASSPHENVARMRLKRGCGRCLPRARRRPRSAEESRLLTRGKARSSASPGLSPTTTKGALRRIELLLCASKEIPSRPYTS